VVADVVAVELEISRPETRIGWAILIFVVILIAFLLNQGLKSLVGSIESPLRGTLLVLFVVFVVLFLYSTRSDDPVGQVDLFPDDANSNQIAPDQSTVDRNSLGGARTQSDPPHGDGDRITGQQDSDDG
jgi:hypothetical protein